MKVFINNNSIIIFAEKLASQLKKMCTIYDDTTPYPSVLYYSYRVTKNSKFGIGYVLPRFIYMDIVRQSYPEFEFINNEGIMVTPEPINIKAIHEPRNIVQQKCMSYLHGINDYIYENKNHVKAVMMQTGLGKTFVTFKYLADTHAVGLILVNQTSFIKQWIDEEMIKHTDISIDDVGIISGLDSVHKIIKNIKEGKKYKLFIGIYRTFYNILSPFLVQDEEALENITEEEKFNMVALKQLVKLGNITVRINDEAHLELKTNFLIDTFFNFNYTIELTATPRSKGSSRNLIKMQNMRSPFYRAFGKEAEFRREPFVRFLFIKIRTSPDAKQITKVCSSRGVSIANYGHYIMDNSYETIIDEIYKLIDKVLAKDSEAKIAIVLPLLDLVKVFIKNITNSYPDRSVGNYTSLIKNLDEREQEKYKDFIITTHKSFTEGKNSPVNVIINLVPLGDGTPIEQLSGRLREVEGKKFLFVEIVDVGFKKINEQFSRRKRFIQNSLAKSITIVDAF